MTLPEKRRRQIFDETEEAQRVDASLSGDTPRNIRMQEDNWVSSFIGRLAALIRDVGGRSK
jgi:hypothetical protein